MTDELLLGQQKLFDSYNIEEWTEYGGYKIAILWQQYTKHDCPTYYFAVFEKTGEVIHKSLQDGGGYDTAEWAMRFAISDIERLLPDPNANPTIEFELVSGYPEESGRYLFLLDDGRIISSIYSQGDSMIFNYEEGQFHPVPPKAWLKKISD